VFYATTGLNWFTSVFTLTVLSVDRYAAICHAVSSASYRTPKLAVAVSAVIWILSLAAVTPVYLYAKTVCLLQSVFIMYCKIKILEIFACPLFREFRDPSKFAKITGSEYLIINKEYCIISIVQQAKMPKLRVPKYFHSSNRQEAVLQHYSRATNGSYEIPMVICSICVFSVSTPN